MAQNTSIRVVLFEDDPKTGPRLSKAIQKRLPKPSKTFLFSPSDKSESRRAHEDRLAADLQKQGFETATLWVSDRDLSRTQNYNGLSEAIVSKVAARFGVPICKYATGTNDDEVFKRQQHWGDAQIVLDSADEDILAAQIVVIATGFRFIAKRLKNATKKTADDAKARTPATVMARLLDRPDEADRIALYGSGDQKMISEILPFAVGAARHRQLQERLPSLLGYWLYDSILRFPGLLVNSIAAASYLNIAVSAFENTRIRKLFKPALYKGPFSDSKDPLWWRKDLDGILIVAKAEDGNSYVRRKLRMTVPRCLDGGKRAGLYCVVTKTPVSEENSVGNIGWFPPGADLARVRRDVYEQMSPWLGLF
jgi:hypothetical protein